MQSKSLPVSLLSLAALFISPVVMAHGADHAYGLADGFMHPATGLDHLLIIIAIGFWAGRSGDHGAVDAVYVLSLFLAGMLLGVCCQLFPLLQLSSIVAIVLTVTFVALAIAKPQYFSYLLFGGFAIYHGVTHILAMPATAVSAAFIAGLLLSTAMLLMVGQILRQVVITRKPHSQSTG